MRNFIVLFSILLFGSCTLPEPKRTLSEQKISAEDFMRSNIDSLGYHDLEVKWLQSELSGSHEVRTYKFLISSNSDQAIWFYYEIPNENPLEFYSWVFENRLEAVQNQVEILKDFQKEVIKHYPNSMFFTKETKKKSDSYSLLNSIYTGIPLGQDNEQTFHGLDSLSSLISDDIVGDKIIFSYYFSNEPDDSDHSQYRFVRPNILNAQALDHESFRNRSYSYQVTFNNHYGNKSLASRKLFDNLNHNKIRDLKASIEVWKEENGYEDYTTTIIQERSTTMDLQLKQFMLKSRTEMKKLNRYINLETHEITTR